MWYDADKVATTIKSVTHKEENDALQGEENSKQYIEQVFKNFPLDFSLFKI